MSDILQVFAGILLVFFLPGYTLVNLLFPRRGELDPEYDLVYRVALGMGLSIVIAIIVGFGLNAISSEEHGYVSPGPLWTTLLSATGLFVLIGWLRGAYPRAGLIHPTLFRPVAVRGAPRTRRADFQRHRTISQLLLEREALLHDIKVWSERSAVSNPQRKLYYRMRIDQARERIAAANEELARLGKEGS